MRIMEIISGVSVNGAIVTCLETIRALCQQGHDITLVCRPKAWIARELKDDDVDIVYSDLHRWPVDELHRLTAIARDKQVEVLHTHMSRANFFGVLLRRFTGIPCVATANNRHLQLHWMFNDYVVAASEATRRFHCRFNLVARHRIGVVHNFIDVHRFHAADAAVGKQLRAELGISENAMLIGVVGDVLKRKGLVYLIRALPAIAEAIPNVHVISVGQRSELDYRDLLRSEAARLNVDGRITYAGFRSDVVNVMSAIDLMVLPTLEDSLPLAILEGMASGLPVVATTVGGLPECVVSGETGWLVPPAQNGAIAAAVISVLADPERLRRFGEAGRERIHTHFSRESQIHRMEQIFQRFAA